MSKAENVSAYRRRRKANLIKVMGNKCCLCGYDKSISALEFHHINPEEKEYGIAKNGTCHDLEKDLAEIKKCILVCANCHREIHDKLYSEKDLWEKQIYNEEIANQLRLEKTQPKSKTQSKIRTKIIYYCNNCGTELYRKSKTGLCENCYKKTTRFVERPSRDELKNLIRKEPFTKIGEKYGVTDNAIRKWCISENLPKKKADINKYSDDEWEKI